MASPNEPCTPWLRHALSEAGRERLSGRMSAASRTQSHARQRIGFATVLLPMKIIFGQGSLPPCVNEVGPSRQRVNIVWPVGYSTVDAHSARLICQAFRVRLSDRDSDDARRSVRSRPEAVVEGREPAIN